MPGDDYLGNSTRLSTKEEVATWMKIAVKIGCASKIVSGPFFAMGWTWPIQEQPQKHLFLPSVPIPIAFTTTTMEIHGPSKRSDSSGDYPLHSVSNGLPAKPADEASAPKPFPHPTGKNVPI